MKLFPTKIIALITRGKLKIPKKENNAALCAHILCLKNRFCYMNSFVCSMYLCAVTANFQNDSLRLPFSFLVILFSC